MNPIIKVNEEQFEAILFALHENAVDRGVMFLITKDMEAIMSTGHDCLCFKGLTTMVEPPKDRDIIDLPKEVNDIAGIVNALNHNRKYQWYILGGYNK